ncbi:EbsA family protein [Fructobacillus parabroussonetiae]|uniref:EbsA family protein n=1 Tax=Fructobacillus parabroussonetiae TaxID=2713174 RepID=A0ABS5QW15_9LACO|nr:EbsA family protein [Fructobacillus parabroussonetiae]MBS9337401.1 EbsA family protein [Fructobacillus parabroussonetiae]
MKTKVYYQPVSDWSKIALLLSLCFLLVSPIWASELFYSVDGYWLGYSLVALAWLITLFLTRYAVIDDNQITLHQLRLGKVKVLSIDKNGQNLRFDKHSLTIQVANQQDVRLCLTKKAIRQLKEQFNGENHSNHN